MIFENEVLITVAELPVTWAGVEVVVAVADVFESASQLVKLFPPKNFPTVIASPRCTWWKTLCARVALLAQKLMVKLKVLAAPLQIGVTVVPVHCVSSIGTLFWAFANHHSLRWH